MTWFPNSLVSADSPLRPITILSRVHLHHESSSARKHSWQDHQLFIQLRGVVVLEQPLLCFTTGVAVLHQQLLSVAANGHASVRWLVVQLLCAVLVRPELKRKLDLWRFSSEATGVSQGGLLTWLPFPPWHGYKMTSVPAKSRHASSRRISPVLLSIQYCIESNLVSTKPI